MKNKVILLAIGSVIISILFAGCATTMHSGYGTNPNLIVPFDVRMVKADVKQVQDYYKSRRVGFTATNDISSLGTPIKFIDLSLDQKHIVQLIGIPEYYRSFPNKSGRRIEEWIYLDQDYLVQFIYGKLVYIGPVDDLEKTLIDLGPPEDIYSIEFAGMRKDIFKYKSRYEIYTFQNDKLIVIQ